MITERLLQFIWQFQHYNKNELQTEQSEALQIIHQGIYNTNQGQDFLQAKIKIDNITLAGNIELHINSSHWLKHKHQENIAYNNTILHVVWQHDKDIFINDKLLPTLSLQSRVAKVLLQRYTQLMQQEQIIVCKNFLPALSTIGWLAFKEKLAVERLQIKSEKVIKLLQKNNNHWEEVFWQMLAANFGITVNADCFENIAQTVPVTILAKHKNQINVLEALLLGQANLLNQSFTEDYPLMLQREYNFYKAKYKLNTIAIQPKFLRMRPAAFPTIRLALLAMLVHNSSHLFSKIKEIETLTTVKQLLNVTANDYWHYHYKLNDATSYKPKNLGTQMVENIIINTIIPVLFAYGMVLKEDKYKAKAIEWLQQLGAEKNNITNLWLKEQIPNTNALHSQALLQLTNSYCKQKKCLQCAVGVKILKS